MRNKVAAYLVLFFLGFAPQLRAQETGSEWSRFRGPNGSGIASEVRLPTDLSPKSAAWSIDLPGPGHSCPVVWGDKIWLTSFRESTSEWVLSCFDVNDGRMLWEQAKKLQPHPMHRLNNPA
ncbi:MAG: hypothetical protein ACKO81_17440, partial [Planctomycetota bacterium]